MKGKQTGLFSALLRVRLPASYIGGLRQDSRTRHFSLNFKTFERRCPCLNACCGSAPMVWSSLAAGNQRGTAFRAGLFSEQKQNRRRVFDRTPKTKPCAQLDATRIHPGNFPEVQDDDSPSPTVQQQVGCLQGLFEPFPRPSVSRAATHLVPWIEFRNRRQRSWRAKTSSRRFPVSFDLLSRAPSDDVYLCRFCDHSLLSDYRRNCVLDAAHQFTRMPPTMYLHWLLGLRTDAACISCFFAHASKVGRRFEIRSSIPGFSATNPKQPRKVHSRSREGKRVKRIGDINERARLLTFRGLRKQRKSQVHP